MIMCSRFIADISGLMPNVSSETARDLTTLRTAVVPLLHMPHASSFVILGGFDDVSTLLLSETDFEDVVISHVGHLVVSLGPRYYNL